MEERESAMRAAMESKRGAVSELVRGGLGDGHQSRCDLARRQLQQVGGAAEGAQGGRRGGAAPALRCAAPWVC